MQFTSSQSMSYHTQWTQIMNETMLNKLIEAWRKDLDEDNDNFKFTKWKIVVLTVRVFILQMTSRSICKNKWRDYKWVWKFWQTHLKQISKWNWDDNLETIVNISKIMNIYFAAHLKMKRFRFASLKYRLLLEKLLERRLVTNEYDMRIESLISKATHTIKDDNLEFNISQNVNFQELKNFSLSTATQRKRSVTEMLIFKDSKKKKE